MSDYTRLPKKTKVKPRPFEAHSPDDKLSDLKQLIKLSPIGPAVYENQQQDRKWGLPRQWLADAKDHWAGQFDWYVQVELDPERVTSFSLSLTVLRTLRTLRRQREAS